MIRIEDVSYIERETGNLLLDIVAPEIKGDELRPAIVYVHGGGWIGGN